VVAEDLRGTCSAVSIAVNAFVWAQNLGDRVGYLMAKVKDSSSQSCVALETVVWRWKI
jgi:hypothetical protein